MTKGRKFAAGALSGGVAVAVSLGLAGVAAAVSGGGYQPAQQDCSGNSDAWSTPQGQTQSGCHNMALNVESGGTSQGNPSSNNVRYAEFGMNQQPIDPNSAGTPGLLSIGYPGGSASPHAGCVAANTDGTNGGTGTGCGYNKHGAGATAAFDYYAVFCPVAKMVGQPCEDTNYAKDPVKYRTATGTGTALDAIIQNGVVVYFGMDDNNDNGEHDGVSGVDGTNPGGYTSHTGGIVNGPSDGGGITISFTPQNATNGPSPTNPEGLANVSTGLCADGICGEATTQRQTVYHGCNAPASTGANPADDTCTTNQQNSNVYDYSNDPSVNSQPEGCNSGGGLSESDATCNGPMNQYRQATAQNVNAEPGVQTYADPDPQRSPADSSIWPTPGIYAGTCGVSVNPGFLYPATDQFSPVTSNLPGYDAQDHQVLAVNNGC